MKTIKEGYDREQGNIEEAARRVFNPEPGEMVRDVDRKNLVNQILNLIKNMDGPDLGRRKKYVEMVIKDRHPAQSNDPNHEVIGGDMESELLMCFAERYFSRGERNLGKVVFQACDDARDTAKEREERRELGRALAFEAPCSTKKDRDSGDNNLTIADKYGEWDAPLKIDVAPTTPVEKLAAIFAKEVMEGRQGSKKSYRARKALEKYSEQEVMDALEMLNLPDMDVKKKSEGK